MISFELSSLFILYFSHPREEEIYYCPPKATSLSILLSLIVLIVLTVLKIRQIFYDIILNLVYLLILIQTIEVTLQYIIEIFLIWGSNILSSLLHLWNSPEFFILRWGSQNILAVHEQATNRILIPFQYFFFIEVILTKPHEDHSIHQLTRKLTPLLINKHRFVAVSIELQQSSLIQARKYSIVIEQVKKSIKENLFDFKQPCLLGLMHSFRIFAK